MRAMKRRTLVILGLMLAFFAASVLLLRLYEVDLVQAVVVNAMVQKSPPSEEERIRSAFAAAHAQSRRQGQKKEYLSKLLQISQRLERTQSIDGQMVEEILAYLEE